MENQIEHPAPAMDEVLTEQLQRVVHRRLWLKIIASLLGVVLLTGSLGLLAAMILGSMNNLTLFFRWGAALVFWIAVIYLIYRQLRPAMRSIDLYNAASLVEQREPEHEERLISAVDFSENPPDDQLVSRQMVEHVIRAVRKDALNIDAARIISVKSVLLRGLFCLPVVLAWIIFCGVAPQTIALGLERMFTPGQGYSAVPALAFQVNPGDAVVGQGSTFEITASDTGNTHIASQAESENSFSVELQYIAGGGRQLAMTPTSPSSRRLDISDVESGFRYRVFSIQDSSPWYTVQMIPRPQITTLELHYKYPAYTGLHDNVTTGPDWKIQALVGTQVQVLIHTSEPLSDQSQLTIAATDSTPEIDLPLQQVDDQKYQAVLNVLASTTYQVRLVNPQGVTGASGSPWPIIAVPDQPPTIVITSPQKQIDVRPDDVIPVLFSAGDDFGLTHVQAVVSVEHSASHVYEINLPAPNTTGFSGQWSLSVPDQLMLASQPNATHLYYLLQAVDNRQPTPQTTRTDEYELVINSQLPYGYQQQLDKTRAAQFGEVLRQAIKNLQQAQRQVDALRSVSAGQALSDRQAQDAQNAADLTAQTARDLSVAAQNNQNSPLSSAATQAQNIANNSIAPAADKIASAALNDAQSPQQRSADLANSAQELSNAASQLQQLQQNLAAQSNQEQLADSVSKLSQQQQQVAQEIADNPDSADAMRNQQQLAKNLQNLIKQNDVLQTPAAAKVQPQIDALKEQTAKIISEQSAVNNQLNGNYQSGDLAQQQALLNKDIQQLNQSSAAADPNTSRIAPSNDALNAAVSDLVNQQYAPAHAGQQNIAADLSSLYHHLDRLAKTSDQQQQSQQTTQQQNAAVTQQMQQITQDVSAATQKLQNPADPQSLTQGFQQTPKVAEEIKSAAEQLSSRPLTAQEQNELTAAVEHASQASDAASWDNAQQATQALQQAQSDLQQVQQQTSAPPPQLPPADQLNQLAQQANNLAVRQQQLAQQAAQLAQQAQAAGQVTPDTAPNLPGQISSAANRAKQIAQQIQNTSPDLAKNLTDAQQEMNKAQEAQQQANNSQPNTPEAAQNQLQALQNMQAAQRALNGAENSPEMQNVSQLNNTLANADQQQNQSDQENQNLEQAQQNQQPQNLNEQNQNQSQQIQQNARQSAQNGQNQNGQTQQSAQGLAQNGQPQAGQEQTEQNGGQAGQQAQGKQGQQGQSGQQSAQGGRQGQNARQNMSGQQSQNQNGQAQQGAQGLVQHGGGNPIEQSQSQLGQSSQQSTQSGQNGSNGEQVNQQAQNSSQNSGGQSGSSTERSNQGGQGQQAQGSSESAQQSGGNSAIAQGNGQGQSSQQSAQNGTPSGQNGNNSATVQGPGGQGSAMQHVLSAAQEIQNALQLQHQAASGDPVAAQQAAHALAAAANDLAKAQAAGGTGSQNAGIPGNGSENSSGNSSGSGSLAMNNPGNSPAQNSSGTPNPNPGGISGTGASAAQNIGSMPPAAVAQMGISPAQWRNLGPLEQQQLINTARQSLPPGYEEMIRDYYIRLSETNSNE